MADRRAVRRKLRNEPTCQNGSGGRAEGGGRRTRWEGRRTEDGGRRTEDGRAGHSGSDAVWPARTARRELRNETTRQFGSEMRVVPFHLEPWDRQPPLRSRSSPIGCLGARTTQSTRIAYLPIYARRYARYSECLAWFIRLRRHRLIFIGEIWMRASVLCIGVALLLAGMSVAWSSAEAQDRPQDESAEQAKKDGLGRTGEASAEEAKIKPYDKVITKEAKTSAGLFLVHRLDDKVFFEIPTEELGKEMLWVTQLEQTQAGYSYGGEPVGDRVVRWEQRGDDVLLRDVKYEIRADVSDPIKDAVEATSLEAIIAVFPVQAYGKDKRPVIDVTSAFTSDLPEFSAKGRLRASGIDPRRTFIEKVKAFPTNIEAKVLMTYRPRGPAGAGGARWACRSLATPTRAASP